MKQVGKITEFDGFSGALINREGVKYIFSNDDLISTDLKVNDIVVFESELYKTVEVEINIARFVKKKQ